MKSLWQESADFQHYEALKGSRNTDVLIIGGGMCGILTAYFLHQKGVNYILLEANKIANATTMNTTAKITSQHGLIFAEMIKRFGKEKTQLYLEANQNAISRFEALSREFDCNFEKSSSFVYSLNNSEKLEKEFIALDSLGFGSNFVKDLPLPLKTVGAVEFKNQAQFNPIMFLSAISKGLNVYENSRVLKIENSTAICENGSVRAKKIIVTTHFPFIDKYGLYFLKMYQSRSYVLALENAPDYKGMYVDECDNRLSFRNYNGLLLLGGYGHRTGKGECGFNRLRAFVNEKIPDAQEKIYWATQDCKTLDDIPYIGYYSRFKNNLLVATGFNKWGMTSSIVAAEMLCDMVLGCENKYCEVFSPSRSIFRKQLLVNSAEAVNGLVGFSKKRCTHLGCKLKWNKAEHSWDCSCHGSRFDNGGNILDGPANRKKNG
ncbi:MAG: FAD-dependent oxidoreductase [Ruminococcaceae bacterium]|nr:FAD-dependent oxidoreductase [Oscillospiraceae bacterium]